MSLLLAVLTPFFGAPLVAWLALLSLLLLLPAFMVAFSGSTTIERLGIGMKITGVIVCKESYKVALR